MASVIDVGDPECGREFARRRLWFRSRGVLISAAIPGTEDTTTLERQLDAHKADSRSVPRNHDGRNMDGGPQEGSCAIGNGDRIECGDRLAMKAIVR